jgi:hypothetical protein
MKKAILAVTAMLAASSSIYAGGLPETIFSSSFEGIEACTDFDGLGDSILIPVVTISGSFSLNGGAFPASQYDDAIFSLRDRTTGDVFEIGNSHDQSYSVRIIPARYDVIYHVQTPGDTVPHNKNAVLMENVALLENGTLDIPVTSYMVGGDMLFNGGQFPVSEYDDAVLFLDGDATGTLELGNTHDSVFSQVPVLPGEYDIRYQAETPDTVPWNQWGLVGQVVVSGNNPNMDINVQSISVNGTFKHNGALMPASEYDDGEFFLETASNDRVFLGNSHDQTFEKSILAGTYDVFWKLETPGDTVPFNPRARIRTNVDISGGVMAINMVSHSISGNFTLNGGAFPNSNQQTGRIVLRDTSTSLNAPLPLTYEGSYDKHILEGEYKILYQHVLGEKVPQNKEADLGLVIVKNDVSLDIDVEAAEFSAPVYHNGVLFPALKDPSAKIFVRDTDTPDFALVGSTSEQTVSALLVADTYDVYYSHVAGDTIPKNLLALIHKNLVVEVNPQPIVQGGGGVFQLDVNSVAISGQMYFNDVSPPAVQFDDGIVTLIRGFDSVQLGNTHDQSYSVRLIDQPEPTLYFVHYALESPGPIAPINGSAYVRCVVLDPIEF